MATGGIFVLVADDGRQDHLLMASKDLRDRLIAIERLRASNPNTAGDPTPTIADIEDTHVLFTSAHFKPFAAIGYEYHTVRPQSSVSALNSNSTQKISFSIPQFGDFFHDMIFHVVLSQPSVTNTASIPSSDLPLTRWCTYPGERLVSQCDFTVNNNPLDSYNSYDCNFYREFCVPSHKRRAWDMCNGQETPKEGYFAQPTWTLNGVAQSGITSRVRADVYDGIQTPANPRTTAEAGDVEMFIPLQFWFNKDSRLAIPSVAIPYGQRFVDITLCSSNELCNLFPRGSGTWSSPNATIGTVGLRTTELYVNNIFVNNEIHDIYIKQVGFNLIRVHKQHRATITASSGSELLHQLKWPVEHMFIGMKIKDYTSTDTTNAMQYMDRWHTFCKVTPTNYTVGGWNSLKKYAIVAAADGAAVTGSYVTATGVCTISAAITAGSIVIGDWVELDPARKIMLNVIVVTDTTHFTAQTAATAADSGAVNIVAGYRKAEPIVTANVQEATIDTITLKSHSIDIYKQLPSAFFNAYIPYHYGGLNISAPTDIGALMLTFNLYPGAYQPSGHLNLSRARETYLDFTSSNISSSTNGLLIVSASAINFLLITDGSAVLRYST